MIIYTKFILYLKNEIQPKERSVLLIRFTAERQEVKFILNQGRLSSLLNSGQKNNEPDHESVYGERLFRDEESQLDVYDPFETPPNFLKAERHYQATSIGIPQLESDTIREIEVCPCCENPIKKQPISICCS